MDNIIPISCHPSLQETAFCSQLSPNNYLSSSWLCQKFYIFLLWYLQSQRIENKVISIVVHVIYLRKEKKETRCECLIRTQNKNLICIFSYASGWVQKSLAWTGWTPILGVNTYFRWGGLTIYWWDPSRFPFLWGYLVTSGLTGSTVNLQKQLVDYLERLERSINAA